MKFGIEDFVKVANTRIGTKKFALVATHEGGVGYEDRRFFYTDIKRSDVADLLERGV